MKCSNACPWLMLLCLMFAAPSHAGTVRGTVRDAVTLAPVSDASLVLHVINPDSIPLPATSDVSGAYVIADVPPGNEIYVLTCSKDGYAGYYARLQDPGSSELVYDVLLEVAEPPPPPGDPPDTTEVTGQIVTPDPLGSMVPIADATVTMHSGSQSFQAFTDTQGHYVMWVPPDVYSATVVATGFETVTDAGLSAEPTGLTYNAVLKGEVLGVPHPLGDEGRIALRGAFPNPVQEAATISYVLGKAGHVALRVYDPVGREVRTLVDGWQAAGERNVTFRTAGLHGGTYYCVLQTGGLRARKPITILR